MACFAVALLLCVHCNLLDWGPSSPNHTHSFQFPIERQAPGVQCMDSERVGSGTASTELLGVAWPQAKGGPAPGTEPTKAYQRWRSGARVQPSLCMLFQGGQCNGGPKCNQAHVKLPHMAQVRQALQARPFSAWHRP